MILVLNSLLADAQYPGPPGQKLPAPPPQAAAASSDEVPPDAVVVTIHGICPPGKAGAAASSGDCTTTLTRQQFEAMLRVMNITNQNYSPAALKGIAESYVQLLVLADAGQRAGLEKDPRFEEMMKAARVRTMAELYRHTLDEKFGAPPADALEAYYKDNIAKYEQLKIDRVFIPLADPKKPQERPVFEKKARRLVEELRERAGKGEDMGALQEEGYKTLGLSSPPKVDQGPKRKGNYPPALEKDIFSLKPAEVTRVETDLSGFSFYKVRSREAIPLEIVKPEVTRELYQKSMEATIKSANSQVHSEFNDKYFKPHVAGPMAPTMRPAPHVTVEGVPANPPGSGAQGNPGGQAPPK
jgi:parvulin-like peptidyl-prolyl cis-trans isomerase-like protein